MALGLSLSTTAMVARRIGEKDPEAAAVTAVQAIVLGVLVAVPTGVVGLLWPRELLTLMGMPPAVVDASWTYTAWMLGGNATILLLFLINAIFRGAGDASLAMRSLWLANAVNIVLDPVPDLRPGTVPGDGDRRAPPSARPWAAPWASLYQLRALARGGRITVARRHLRVESDVMLRLLRVSLGGIVQFLIATASWLGLVRILTPFGAAALAGYTIAIRIIVVAILPSWGLCNAAATLVGQNLGARQAGARGALGLAHRPLQHGVPGAGGAVVHRLRGAARRRLHDGSGGARAGRATACASSATATSSTPGAW